MSEDNTLTMVDPDALTPEDNLPDESGPIEEIGGIKYPIKFKLGRPTKYDPRFCEMIIQAGKLGKSSSYMCAMLAIGRTTFERFLEKHEDFRKAYQLAQEYACAWWEDCARVNIHDPKKSFNANLYAFHMRNRHKYHYSESMGSVVAATIPMNNHAIEAGKEVKEKLDELERKIRDSQAK